MPRSSGGSQEHGSAARLEMRQWALERAIALTGNVSGQNAWRRTLSMAAEILSFLETGEAGAEAETAQTAAPAATQAAAAAPAPASETGEAPAKRGRGRPRRDNGAAAEAPAAEPAEASEPASESDTASHASWNDLPAEDKLVARTIAFIGSRGGQADRKLISDLTDLDADTVDQRIRNLRAAGWLNARGRGLNLQVTVPTRGPTPVWFRGVVEKAAAQGLGEANGNGQAG